MIRNSRPDSETLLEKCYIRLLIHTDADSALTFRWLNDNRNIISTMPLKLIRLSGCLADESFPGYIGSDTGITVAVSNPADHSIRIYGNGIIPANSAQYNRVAV